MKLTEYLIETMAAPKSKRSSLTSEEMDSKLFDHQYDVIKLMHGKKAADNANYGWGSGGDDKYASIATKVYVNHEDNVLTTGLNYATGEMEDEWSSY